MSQVALDRLARLATCAIRAPMALIMVMGDDGVRIVGSAGLPDPTIRHVPSGSLGQRVAARGACSDAAVLRDTWEARSLGACAALGSPLRAGEEGFGALVVLDSKPRVWTAEELRTAQEIAETITVEFDLVDARARLLRAESHQAVLERSPEAILVHVEGEIRFANAAAVSLLGAKELGDLVGRNIDAFLAPPYLKGVSEALVEARPSGGTPPLSEERLTRMDGSVRDVEVATLAYLRGEVPAVQMFMRDVTDRRIAREALRKREAHLRLLMERIPAFYWTADRELRMESWSPGMLPSSPGTGLTVQAFFGTSAESPPVTTHEAALGGAPASDIMEWRGVEYEVRVEPLRDDRGAVAGTVGVAVDTTLRRGAEARERAEREIEALGRVAGGVAHGVNNALATVVGVTSVMLGDPAFGHEVQRNFQAILAACERAHALTSNLLGFARQGRYRLGRVDLNELAREAAEWARKHHRMVTVDLAPDLPMVEGDVTQLRQAVFNVSQNAVDATRGGGEIRIYTRREHVERINKWHPMLEAGPYACMRITDTGAGMSEEVRARAIDPFFTTKKFGEGTGLGLSMAYGVMRHHGGNLHVASAQGTGTTVTYCLPALKALPAPDAAPPGEGAGVPERRAVLVVDDDEWVMYSSRKILDSLGFDVVEARSGVTALRLFLEHRHRLSLVLLDLRMPGMDGEEVLRRLVAIDTDVRVIICTGFQRDQVSQRIFTLGRVGFLGKPFTAKDLLEQLRELDAHA